MRSVAIALALSLCLAQAHGQTASTLYDRAATLEAQARSGGAGADKLGPTAVYVYEQAARVGSGKASKRLGEIYASGLPGVARNDMEAAKWRDDARALGEEVPATRQERIARQRAMDEMSRMEAEKAKEQSKAMRDAVTGPKP